MHDPFLLMVAGPNGAGKSTLTRLLQQSGADFGEYINPDDIARELIGPYEARVSQAQDIADQRRDACIEARRSFSFETVMSHPSKVDILIRAKAAGFYVQLFFVGTDDPQTNVERVALRVEQGGHDVPADRIVARWYRTMGFLHRAIMNSDESLIFDNSVVGNVDSGPRLVFRVSCPWSFSNQSNIAPPFVTQQFPPLPEWVQHHVLKPLSIDLVATKK